MRLSDIPITDILRDYCSLDINSNGGRVGVKCPLHNGVSASSLSIYLDTNSANCFGGCGYLDSVGIVARVQGISPVEARKELMRKYGISALTPEEEEEIRKLGLLERYVSDCQGQLNQEHVGALKARGLTESTIQEYQIGFHGQSSLSDDELKELGVSAFTGKIILPCFIEKKLVYAIAWNWEKLPDEHKYTKPAGWKTPLIGTCGDNTLLVEGYFDMISLHQEGFSCLCGITDSLSKSQKEQIAGKDIIISFDTDESGQRAQEALAAELFPRAKIGNPGALGACKDLNDLLVKVGPEKFKEIVAEVIAGAEDLLDKALNRFDILKAEDSRKAGKFVYDSIVPLLAKLSEGERKPAINQVVKATESIGIKLQDIKRALKDLKPEEKKEEEPEIEILETVPDLVTQPLALIGNKALAVTKVWVNHKVDGTETKMEQCYAVSNDGEVVPMREAEKKFNVTITLKDLPLSSLLLSGKAVNAFQAGYRPSITDVFNRIMKVFDTFIDFSLSFASQAQMCMLSAILSLLTWFRLATEALPYPKPEGEKESGKTQWGIVWSMISFLGRCILSGSSFAVIRDYAGYGASLMIDDAERLMDKADKSIEGIREIILTGYRKGTTVELKYKKADEWETKIIDAYCPKAFTAIKAPEGAFASRLITIPLVRSINPEKTNKDPMNPRSWPCDPERLKDDLWLCALLHIAEARDINDELNNEKELCGRDYERFKGVFMVARLLDRHGADGIEAQMREVAQLFFSDSVGISANDERIPIIIIELEKLFEGEPDSLKEKEFSSKDFAAAVTQRARDAGILSEDRSYSAQGSLGRLLTSLRVKKDRTSRGKFRCISRGTLAYLKEVFREKNISSDTHTNSEKCRQCGHESDNDAENPTSTMSASCGHHVGTADMSASKNLQDEFPDRDSLSSEKAYGNELPLEFSLEEGCPF